MQKNKTLKDRSGLLWTVRTSQIIFFEGLSGAENDVKQTSLWFSPRPLIWLVISTHVCFFVSADTPWLNFPTERTNQSQVLNHSSAVKGDPRAPSAGKDL